MGIYFPISFSESNRKFSENDTRGQIGKDINQHQYCHHSQWKMTKDLAKKWTNICDDFANETGQKMWKKGTNMCNTLANKKILWEIWQYRMIIIKMIRMLMMMSIMMQYKCTQVNMSTRDGGGEMAMMIWWYSMMMMLRLCMQVNMRKRDGRGGRYGHMMNDDAMI